MIQKKTGICICIWKSADPVRGHQACEASVVLNVYCSIVLYVVLFYMYSVPWGLKPGGGEVTPQIDVGLGSVRSELQPSLEVYSERSRTPKDLQNGPPNDIKMHHVFQKVQNAIWTLFYHTLDHFWPPNLTSKSIKKRSKIGLGTDTGFCNRLSCTFSHQNENFPKKVQKGIPKQGGKKVAKSHLETPLTQGGPQMDPRSSKVVQQTPKWPQNESKISPKWHQHVWFLAWIRAKGHVIFVCCIQNSENSV